MFENGEKMKIFFLIIYVQVCDKRGDPTSVEVVD